MKITQQTITILKNFSTLNKGIFITPGNVLRTRTTSVLAEAVVEETFPTEVGIYDLANFLNVITLFDKPEFEFEEEYLRITEENKSAESKYQYAGQPMVQLSTKLKEQPKIDDKFDFVLTEEQWTTLQKACSFFNKPELKIVSDGKTVTISTENHKQPSANAYSLVAESEPHGFTCNMVFNMEHLKLLKGSYQGTVNAKFSGDKLATWTDFKNTSGFNLKYMVAPEPSTAKFGSN